MNGRACGRGAGPTLPWYVLTGTITATCVGTGVVVGSSGTAYEYGWAGSAYPIGLGLGLGTLLAGLLFAKMRRYNFVTLSEEIASYYDNNRLVVEFSNISLFASQLFWLTTQILGGAVVLAVVTGLSQTWCVALSGLIIAAIAIPGGLKAVAYTDTLQAVILLIGLGCLTYSALENSGGPAGMSARVPAAYNSFLGHEAYGAWNLVNLMVVVCLSVIADPGRRLSMFSARTEAGARWSMVLGGSIVMAFSLVIGVIGMYAYELNPNLPQRDQAVPWLVTNVLPAWLAAFVVVSIASATFSSASTNAIAAVTYFVRHIYPLFTGGRYAKRPLLAVRVALVVATPVALQAGNIVAFVKFFLPLTKSGLAVIILLGLLWPRATWQGAGRARHHAGRDAADSETGSGVGVFRGPGHRRRAGGRRGACDRQPAHAPLPPQLRRDRRDARGRPRAGDALLRPARGPRWSRRGTPLMRL